MAVLNETDRASVWRSFIQRNLGLSGLTKAELRAAVDALDDFFDANATAINNAIPLPARTALTSAQKALLLVHVIDQRYLSGA